MTRTGQASERPSEPMTQADPDQTKAQTVTLLTQWPRRTQLAQDPAPGPVASDENPAQTNQTDIDLTDPVVIVIVIGGVIVIVIGNCWYC